MDAIAVCALIVSGFLFFWLWPSKPEKKKPKPIPFPRIDSLYFNTDKSIQYKLVGYCRRKEFLFILQSNQNILGSFELASFDELESNYTQVLSED